MQDTFIHIGFPKTGSTYIQSRIFAKLENFDYLTPPYTQHDEQWNRLQYGDNTQFQIKEFSNYLSSINFKNKNLLISDEGLVGKPIFGGMQRTLICKRLKNCFPDAKILIIIRGQFDMLKSLHNQWVKGARQGTKTFGDFIWYKRHAYNPAAPFTLKNMYFNTNEDYVHLDFLNYLDIIELYKNSFSEVKILPYELLIHDMESYVNEISKFLKITIDPKKLNKTKENLSLSKKKLAENIVANCLKNLSLNQLESKLLIKRCTNSIYEKNEQEYSSNIEIIKAYYKDSNSKIEDRYPEIGLNQYSDYY